MTDMTDRELPVGGPQPHLSQMFATGKPCTIVYPGKPEIDLWVVRPSSPQSTKAQRNARVERARRFRELTDKKSEEAMALDVQVAEFTKGELVDNLLDRTRRKREQQAYNEVLYSDDHGSKWGDAGSKYLELLDAVIARMEEINLNNIEMEAAETPDGVINPMEDEEMLRLNREQSEFEKEVLTRTEQLTKDERSDISVHPIDKLRRDLREALVDTECDMLWFSVMRLHMAFYAIRYPDNHSKLYFGKPDDIDDLPEMVKNQIYSAYEDVDMEAEQTKNLLTPLDS